MSEVEHPHRILVGAANLETYFPELQQKMERFGDHRFMEGLDVGMGVAQKLCIWLSSKPPIPHAKLREYVIAEINDTLKKHEDKTPDNLSEQLKLSNARRNQ